VEPLERRQAALLELIRMPKTDLAAVFRRTTQLDAEMVGVQRVSIWLYNDDRSDIVCQDLFKLNSGSHERGLRLAKRDFPRYFAAMDESRILAADDAVSDPRTSEFTETYLQPFGITSMLDVPIWVRGKVRGVLCHEHTGPRRHWTVDEQDFGAAVADTVSIALLENQIDWIKR
jgi:GAF domain-containing protein